MIWPLEKSNKEVVTIKQKTIDDKMPETSPFNLHLNDEI